VVCRVISRTAKVLIARLTLQLFKNGLFLNLVLHKPLSTVMIGVMHHLELINADLSWSLHDLDIIREDFRLPRFIADRAVTNTDTELMLLLDGAPRLLLLGKLNTN
jgi:hypothetical protein